MNDPVIVQVFALTLLAVAFPFRNWLVMLKAIEARQAREGERPWQRGMAKPETEEDGVAGTFSGGF